MDVLRLRNFPKPLSPFEIKDELIGLRREEIVAVRYPGDAERRTRPIRTGSRPRRAPASILLGQFAHHGKSERVMRHPAGTRRDAASLRRGGAAGSLAGGAQRRAPGAAFLSAMLAFAVAQLRLQPRRLRARTGG